MKQYKTIPGPAALSIRAKDSYDIAVRSYAEIIAMHAVGGWELHSIHSIPVIREPGCLAALRGAQNEIIYFNMLIFVRDV